MKHVTLYITVDRVITTASPVLTENDVGGTDMSLTTDWFEQNKTK